MIEKWFQDKLTELGGYYNGSPRLRVVKADEVTHFACGEIRIKYPIGSRTEEKWLWGLKDLDTGITTAKSEQDVIDNHDPGKFGVRKLVSRTVTFFGPPNYVIEYYRSPLEMKDGPVNWEKNRYNWWLDPVTETRKWTDMIGPFPREGRYDELLIVKEDDGTRWGKFRELGQDVLDEVERAVVAHKAFRKVLTDEESIRHMFEAAEAEEDRLEAEMADEVEQDIGQAWRRLIKNNPKALLDELAKANALEQGRQR